MFTTEKKFRSEETMAGMTPSQSFGFRLLEEAQRDPVLLKKLRTYVDRDEKRLNSRSGLDKFFDGLERLVLTPQEMGEEWFRAIAKKVVIDSDGGPKDDSYLALVSGIEQKWNKIRRSGIKGVEARVRDFVTTSVTGTDTPWDRVMNLVSEKIEEGGRVYDKAVYGGRGLAIGSGLAIVAEVAAGCGRLPPAEVAPLPSDEAISLGLIDATNVDSFADSEFKELVKNHLDTVNERCSRMPGCEVGSGKIHPFVVDGKLVVLEFVNFNDKADNIPYTKILRIIDESGAREINAELLSKSGNLSGESVTQIGWVDENRESHYVYKINEKGDLSVYYQGEEYKIQVGSGNIEDKESLITKIMGFGVTPVSAEAGKTSTPSPTSTETRTVTPTATSTEKPSPTPTPEPISQEFTKRHPAEWSESKMVEIDGIEMPISIGLTHWVRSRPSEAIKEIRMGEGIPEVIAKDFLQVCYLRYQDINSVEISYEEYMDLVRAGQGKVEFIAHDDSKSGGKPQVVEIDPSKGISFVYVDESLPTKINYINRWDYSESNGKLIVAINLNSSRVSENLKAGWTSKESLFQSVIADDISDSMRLFGLLDECLLNENCIYSMSKIYAVINGLMSEYWDFNDGKRGDVFVIEQEE